MASIKLSDYIAKRLKEHYDVDLFFMISGGGAMHLNDSLGRYLPYVCNHHEQACAIAAEGYARIKQKLAVVNVTTGPGGLNCLNGIFGQWTDSVPVLYISGQVKFATTKASCPDIPLRQLGDQEVDIISVVKPLTKYAEMVTQPHEIKYHLDKAIHEATTGRFGPVWLDIPMNIQAAMIDEDNLSDFFPAPPPTYDLKIEKVLDKIKSAKRPLIIAGQGIRLAGQSQIFQQIIKLTSIPVVTTFNGFDILEENNPNYIGRIGTIGQRAGNFALQNADVVLCLGTRNNIRQISYNYENFAQNALKIIIDIDTAELEKPTVRPDLAIAADLNAFLPALLASLTTEPLNITTFNRISEWLAWCKIRKQRYSFIHSYIPQETEIDPYNFTYCLSKIMAEDTVFVMANGSACVCTFQTATIKKGQRYLLNSGDASMGYDLPAAIGACIANPKGQTVCLAGDGSIMMNIQELQTIKHHKLPIKIFILNNQGYSSIKQTQKNFFNGQMTGAGHESGVSFPDFLKIADSFGIKAIRLDCANNVDTVIGEVLSADEPVICEVVVKSDYIFTPKLSSKTLEDGSLVSPSLEDMYPFLPKAEFEENMISET